MDACTIFFNMIDEFCGPLLNAAGYRISPQGFIEDDQGNKIFYQNPKYVEGTHDPQNPQFTFPVVPIDERSYLNIKATPEMELFNPFQNYKHACIVLIKLKRVLIPCYVDKQKLNAVDEDDWNREFDDYFQIYSRVNEAGLREVGVVDTQDPANPKELMNYTSDDLTKAVWGLSVLIYNNFCAVKPLKQFKNIDRSWNKTQKLCDEWNKLRATLMQQVKIEQENVLNSDMVDYTDGMDDKNIDILPFDVNKFVEPINCEDKHDPVLQQYLTNMFPMDQLIPYEEPEAVEEEPEPDDQGVGLNVTPLNHAAVEELVQPDTSMPSFEEMEAISGGEEVEDGEEPVLDISDAKEITETVVEPQKDAADVLEGMAMQAAVKEEEEIEQESRSNSVFSFNKPAQQRPQQQMNPMMGGMMGGFGMMGNPMMNGMMNPMTNYGMNPLPPTNIDDINLCSNHVDPFAAYR